MNVSCKGTMSLNTDDSVAASLASDLVNDYWKRFLPEADVEERAAKKARVTPELGPAEKPMDGGNSESKIQHVGPPFFYYRDFSNEVDPDPLTPLTPPGRVPNFPAKMHAILSRADLVDVIAWMPHGRSWRVLKPREFELRVIPTYFEHSKFSSFIRQANGWGFRRVTQGRDRNSYYHELFLRGLPHLCKKMKRPGVAEKGCSDAEHEPDFAKISEFFPLPERSDDESILLQCTVTGGPKARMPIYSGAYLSADKIRAIHGESEIKAPEIRQDHPSMVSFHNSLATSENQIRIQPPPSQPMAHQQMQLPQMQHPPVPNPMMFFPQAFIKQNAVPPQAITAPSPSPHHDNQLAMNATNDRLSFHSMPQIGTAGPHDAAAASQFAAGFAAATALNSTSHFCNSVMNREPMVNSPSNNNEKQYANHHIFE